ncbi:hypothetical protein BGZ73_000797 [Actinomortierella ambigua]|nr:hypothetical protein BGZ73_000797 [Actinomortierella ambigua]
MSSAGDDGHQRPRFPPPPVHLHSQHQHQHPFRPGAIPVRAPGQVPPFIHPRLPHASLHSQLAQSLQGQSLPHPQFPPNHPLNMMHQHPRPGGVPGHPQHHATSGAAFRTAVHHQNMVFPPPTPRVRRESGSSGSLSPISPTRPPMRDLPPIPSQDTPASRGDSEGLSSSEPASSKLSSSGGKSKDSTDSIQQRVKTLREGGEDESALSKAVDRGVVKAIDFSAPATIAATAVTTTVALATKAMSTSEGRALVNDTGKNPILAELIQLADKLVDLGKTIPFIAPAFLILKVIIDVESKVREVDMKCNDLLERISFLVSHLFVLEKIKTVDESVKQVVERMHVILKEAAALIEAYRKQSAIARRLKVSNNQNFTEMAAKVAQVAEDLMFSLQIQQVGDISIIKRSIPLDDQDQEAKQFIEKHGGQSAIESNPKLVEEFAKKMHLTMSDQVMEQMQTDLGDMLQENQSRIEDMLKETSRDTVAEVIKAMAKEAREQAEEKKVACIQCESEYRPSSNGPEACSFHPQRPDYGGYSCCGRTTPCQTNYHRTDMHCDYPFPAFFDYARSIIGYTDTVDYWANIEDENMLTNESQLRTNAKYFFKVYSPEDLEEISQNFQKDPQASKLLFKTQVEHEEEFSMAEWMTNDDGVLTGLQLTVRVETFEMPTSCQVPLDLKTCEIAGEVTYVSKAAFRLYKPASEYVLPETKQAGEVLRATPLREVRKFKAKTNGVPVMMVPEGDLVANSRGRFVRPDADKMQGTLTFYNRSPAASQEPVVLMSAKAEYRFVGDDTYQAVDAMQLDEDLRFPLTIEPGKTMRVPYTAIISRGSKLKDLYLNIWGWALVALHRPLRLRVTFTDIDGREMSHVQDYVHKPRSLQEAKEEDLGFFHIDNLLAGSRTSVRISKPNSYDHQNVVSLNGTLYDADQLNKLVFRALHEGGKTELEVHKREDNECHWKIFALIDPSCRRIYAFKVIMTQGPSFEEKTAGVIGYVRCPYYGGDDLEERPIQYAVEEAVLPTDLQPATPIDVVMDDTVDDDTVPNTPSMSRSRSVSPTSTRRLEAGETTAAAASMLAPAVSIATATSTSVTAALQEVSKVTAATTATAAAGFDQTVFVNSMQSLERRLESLDTNVARMATALEKLVEILKP